MPAGKSNAAVRPRVVIIGGGFGGIHAAMGLADKAVDVTIVDRRNYHLFQPLLYQVALAVLSPADIAQPIRTIVRHHANIEVLMDEATGFDLPAQQVQLKSGTRLEFDYLILATGSTHSYFGKDEWAAVAPGLKTIEDAVEIRRRVLLAFELAERQMLETGQQPALNFVVIGGGPTGVELAGAISDISRLYMTHRLPPHRPVARPRSSSSKVRPRSSPCIRTISSSAPRRQLEKLGVHDQDWMPTSPTSSPATSWSATSASNPSVTLWAAGVQAIAARQSCSASPIDKQGLRLSSTSHLNPSLPDGKLLENVFICGDLAHVEQDGKQVPGVAQPAMQMGDYAARRILTLVAGRTDAVPERGFRYFDKGDMATIGRAAAVAKIEWPFKGHWSGFPAFMVWLVVHIFFLIGFRNRISVFAQWAWTYLTFRDGVRLITGSQLLPGWETRDDPQGQLTTRPVSDTQLSQPQPAIAKAP